MRHFGIPSQPDPESEWDIEALWFGLLVAAPLAAIAGVALWMGMQ